MLSKKRQKFTTQECSKQAVAKFDLHMYHQLQVMHNRVNTTALYCLLKTLWSHF